MNHTPHHIYHIYNYNQGNNRQKIFLNSSDYLIFLSLYNKLILPYSETLAWCLMPNHFHFMIYTDDRCTRLIKQGGLTLDPVTNGFRKLLSNYARIFNKNYKRSGSLFRQKTKSICLSELQIESKSTITIKDYYINCFYYIHQNPLRANLVKKPEEWVFSSYLDYAGMRNGKICNKELAEKFCNYDLHDLEKKIT